MNNFNTARAHNIKHNSPEVKDVCHFAERVRHMLDVKINQLRTQKSKDNVESKDSDNKDDKESNEPDYDEDQLHITKI